MSGNWGVELGIRDSDLFMCGTDMMCGVLTCRLRDGQADTILHIMMVIYSKNKLSFSFSYLKLSNVKIAQYKPGSIFQEIAENVGIYWLVCS